MKNQQNKSFLKHSMAKWGLFVGLLFALWFGGWFLFANFADGKIGEALAGLKSRGVDIQCDERSMKGFPFRIGVHCGGVKVTNQKQNFQFESGALKTTAILYAPGEMIAELDSPLTISPAGQKTTAHWKTMRVFADAKLTGGFDLISLTYSNLDVQSFMTKLLISEGGLHLRPSLKDNTDLDIAGNANDLNLQAGKILNTPPATFNFDALIKQGYTKFVTERQSIKRALSNGIDTTIRIGSIKVPNGGQIAIKGPLTINNDGTLSGKITIGVKNPKAVAAWAGEINPKAQQVVALIGQSVAGMGKKTTFGAVELRAITIKLNNGIARLGFIELGRIPPLRLN